MSQVELTVDKATRTKYDNYKLTLKSKGTETGFGVTANKVTYYMYVAPNANNECPAPKGKTATIDLDLFKIEETDFTTDDGREMKLKNRVPR